MTATNEQVDLTQIKVENDEYAQFARRVILSFGRRVGSGDVEAMAHLAALDGALSEALDTAVANLRGPHWRYSWADIGRVLGITRQAARKRWSHLDGPDSPEE